MQQHTIGRPVGCISALDRERLETLIERTFTRDQAIHPTARAVLQRLRNPGAVARPEQIPPGVVTMNSTVRLVAEAGDEVREITLVYPEDPDPEESCWSVFHPVGAAVFGLCVGECVDLPATAGGVVRWRIAEVPFQPEARGFLSM